MVSMVLFGIQLLVTCIVGIYFYTQLRSQQKSQPSHRRDSGRELEKLQKRIHDRLKSVLGLETRVTLVEPKSLERFQGKAKRILDLRNDKE